MATPTQTSVTQSKDSTGQTIYTASYNGAPSISASFPLLSQAQLDAQNASRGITQYNTGPARVGGAIGTGGDYTVNSSVLSSQPVSIESAGGSTGSITGTGTTNANYTGALAGALSSLQTTANGTEQKVSDPNQFDSSNLAGIVKSLYSQVTPVNSADIYAKEEQAAGLAQKQQDVNDYTAQLKSITAKSQAAQLSLTGQGRGIPEAIIGGQQAQIAKEAAIQALPVAALLEAAQGNLQMAQQHVDTYAKLLISDAQSQHDQQIAVIQAVIPIATAAEQRRLQVLDNQTAQTNALTRDNVNFAQSLVTNAITNGDKTAAAGILKLMANPTSPTFMKDVSAYAGQMQGKRNNQIIGSADTGYINVITDAQGRVVSSTPISGGHGSNSSDVVATAADQLSQVLKGNKVGATTKTTIGNLLGVIDSAETLAQANPKGKFVGISPFNAVLDAKIPFTDIGIVPFRQAAMGSQGITNRGYLDAINLRVQQWASGASLTAQQIEQVNKLVPRASDTDTNVKTKLNNLVNVMNGYIKGDLAAEGIQYEPAKVDLFAQTLDQIFK